MEPSNRTRHGTAGPAPRRPPHPADPAASSVDDELAHGRRLVVVIVLAACLWLALVLLLWTTAVPVHTENVAHPSWVTSP